MQIKKWLQTSLACVFVIGLLAACSKEGGTSETTNDKVQAIATFSIIHDIVTEIGGDLVDVHSMVPIGTDPHEYDPLPEDIKKASNADVLFYNGLNLEGGEQGWFFKLVENVNADDNKVFELMKGIEPLYLTSADGNEKEVNPHAFLDPNVVIQMTENARDALIEVDSDNQAKYEENADKLLDQLQALDQDYQTKIAEIPEENRVLVTSERAYQYMAKRYGLEEGFIWEIDTEENGTPAQIKALVKFIQDHKVPALFVETNVDGRPMETVSNETGIPIAAKLFSDELGRPGSDGSTVIDFLQHNIDTIHEHLAK